MEKPPEILAGCLAISRLVSAADDDVHSGPTLLAKIVAPPCEERVQLFELDTHGQLRSLERVWGEGADVFLEPIKIDDTFRKNPVDERARAAQ